MDYPLAHILCVLSRCVNMGLALGDHIDGRQPRKQQEREERPGRNGVNTGTG